MGELASELSDIQEELSSSISRFGIPAANLGVWRDGDAAFFGAGVLNVNTGVEATANSAFQIGSITKLFTATLMMQLVDEERVELDAPVKRYLPDFSVADPAASAAVTIRHLLTHTSGIDGDFFLDTGRGDDCLERYVLACAALPQLHPPGEAWSYCNAGFIIAGHVIQKVTGMTWDRALRERLLRPIGADNLVTLPEDALTRRTAAGHFPGEDGKQRVVPMRLLPRSNGPAGSTPFGTTADLVALARMHLDEGRGAQDKQVLSAASVRMMQEAYYDFDRPGDRGQGLGWFLFDWSGQRVIGHDGGTIGQASFLRVLPAKRMVVALLTNGGNAGALYRYVFGLLLARLAGVTIPEPPRATEGLRLASEPYVGSYAKLSGRIDVVAVENGLQATLTPLKSLIPGMPVQVLRMNAIDERYFVQETSPTGPPGQVFAFDGVSGGSPATSVSVGRMHPRIA
jgi:CubicO group peptidase (beta-lactamase class C family)